MIAADAVKAAALLFVAAIVQVSILNSTELFGGTPDLLLVALISVALVRGSVFGAVAGFAVGLVVDTATLGTLGVTALLYTLAGFWTGRYGETTGRDRTHAPLLSVGVITILYALGAFVLDYMLGDHPDARRIFVEALPMGLVFNLLLTAPVYALVRRLIRLRPRAERVEEVTLLG